MRPHGLYPARLLCPRDFPSKNIGKGCHFLSKAAIKKECVLCSFQIKCALSLSLSLSLSRGMLAYIDLIVCMWKSWLKAQHSENQDHGIWSHHFMANRWGNNGNSNRLWGSKITSGGHCSHEIKRCLLLGRKVMTNLHSTFKGRDITLLTKVRLVKAIVSPVVMYGCESWTIKKAEHWRSDAFELWCWRRLLRVPWTARRSN